MNLTEEMVEFIPFQYPKMCPMCMYKSGYRMEDPEVERKMIELQQQL